MKILGNDLKISLKELIFQRCLNKFLATRFEDFHRSCRNCYAPRNRNYCGQSLARLVRFRVSQKIIVKTLLIIFLLVKTE